MNKLKCWFLVLAITLAAGASIHGQGDLEPPPGPPAATMRTLTQVEPRTPLEGGTTPISIENPGSYYLTGPLTVTGNVVAISITKSEVTLDLNGFAVTNTQLLAGTGIDIQQPNVVVHNGVVRGFGTGIAASTTRATQVRQVTFHSILGNSGYAMDLGHFSTVEGCLITNSQGMGGIKVGNRSLIKDCVIGDQNASAPNGYTGITGALGVRVTGVNIGNMSAGTGTFTGISLGNEASVESCSVGSIGSSSTSLKGIDVGNYSSLKDCLVTEVNTFGSGNVRGITAGAGSSLNGCTASRMTGGSIIGIFGSPGTQFTGCLASQLIAATNCEGMVGDTDSKFLDCMVQDCSSTQATKGIRSAGGTFQQCRVSQIQTSHATSICVGIEGGEKALVESCQVKNIRGHGIQVAEGSRVVGNHVSFCNDSSDPVGIKLNAGGNLVEGNTVSTATIAIDSPSGANRIIGNSVTVGTIGIRAEEAANVITGNTVQAVATGIRAADAGNAISKNHVFNCSATGILALGTSNAITENTLASCVDGILVSGSSNLLEDNRVSTCSAYGIRLTAGYNTIKNCMIDASTTAILSGGQHNIIMGNNITGGTTGIHVTATLNFISRNHLRTVPTGFNIAVSNYLARVYSPGITGAAVDNSNVIGSGFASSDPDANYKY